MIVESYWGNQEFPRLLSMENLRPPIQKVNNFVSIHFMATKRVLNIQVDDLAKKSCFLP